MKKLLIVIAVVIALIATGTMVMAKGKDKGKDKDAPVENVSAKKHPNLHAAQKHINEAFEKLTAAQKANEFDMDGHAAKAKDLLEEASKEIKLSAETANKNTEEPVKNK